MFKKYLIQILLFMLLMPPLLSAQNDSICDKYLTLSYNCIWQYNDDAETAKLLDSAMLYLDTASTYCENHLTIIIRKLNIFSLKHQYDTAIAYLENNGDLLWPMLEMPYYWTVCKKRFLAMKYADEGNIAKKEAYIRSIINDIDDYMCSQRHSLDSICVNENLNEITNNTLAWIPLFYFYYLGMIKSDAFINKKLHRLTKKGYNPDYVEFLRPFKDDDFFIFDGF